MGLFKKGHNLEKELSSRDFQMAKLGCLSVSKQWVEDEHKKRAGVLYDKLEKGQKLDNKEVYYVASYIKLMTEINKLTRPDTEQERAFNQGAIAISENVLDLLK